MHPTIMPLPFAPSRVGDPDNFLTEADVWLGRQSNFRTQGNSLSNYLNTLGLDLWNWGLLTDPANPVKIFVQELSELPAVGEAGTIFANKTDELFASAEEFSYDLVQVADFADALSLRYGGTFFNDADRPILLELSANPLRGDTPSEFETKSGSYYLSFKNYATKVKEFNNYVYDNAYEPEDFGSINDTVIEVKEFGLITGAL